MFDLSFYFSWLTFMCTSPWNKTTRIGRHKRLDDSLVPVEVNAYLILRWLNEMGEWILKSRTLTLLSEAHSLLPIELVEKRWTELMTVGVQARDSWDFLNGFRMQRWEDRGQGARMSPRNWAWPKFSSSRWLRDNDILWLNVNSINMN